MYDTICTLPLTSDLFAQAIHPSESILAVGLASGHVQTYRLPPVVGANRNDGNRNNGNRNNGSSTSSVKNGGGAVETSWRTKRHKGSCRSLAFSVDGESLVSAGTDGIVKIAATETGRVGCKIGVPLVNSSIDAPALIHILSPQTLLLATDSSALHLYDLRSPRRPQQSHYPHDDYVSSLTPLPPTDNSTSGFSKQWVSTGGTTLAVTDLRRGVLVKSEDQEEELLSSVFVAGLPAKKGRGSGEKVLVGDGSGVLTLWEKGVWDDQDERIIVGGGEDGKESLDVMATVPGQGKMVAVGMGDGMVRLVRLGVNKVVAEMRHDEVEGVLGLGFETEGRMISGGGQVVKIWEESVEEEEKGEGNGIGLKRGKVGDSEESDSNKEDGRDSSDEEEKRRKRRKKRKRRKGKDQNGGQHVLAFKGMD